MIKKIISVLLACVMVAGLSFSAYAQTTEATEEPKLNYIHTDIKETYISAYRLYEQVMYDQIVFYTNISNGNITSNPVVIELPSELETIFEKDGTEIKFTSKAEIKAVGSYSLTVIAKGEDILGGEKNDRYYGLFRFRIMESSAIVPPDAGIDVNDWEQDDPPVYTAMTLPPEEPTPDETIEEQTSESPETVEATTDSDSSSQPESTSSSTSANVTSQMTAASGTGTTTGTPSEMPVGDKTLILQSATDMSILLTTTAGTQINTNIPRDMITTSAVKFKFATNVQHKLYKDGTLVNGYIPSSNITEAGKYKLFIYDGSGTLPAEFDFEIRSPYIAALTEFTVPSGCQIQKALYEGNMIRVNPTSVPLGGDGAYTIDVAYENYTFSESIILDNTPPVFGFDRVVDGVAEGGTVTILFKSEDTSRYEVYKDGERVAKQKQTISEPGTYIVKVYDRAGNMSQQEFELEYRMDGMATLVVIILVGIVIAGVVFFIVSRRRFIIR